MNFNMKGMMEQAQKVQQEMERVKNEVHRKVIETDAGGGMVNVKITGANEILEIKIAPEIVDKDDIEMLEDLVAAAVNKAIKDAADMVHQEMSKVTGMLPNIPGLNLGI